MNHTTLLIFKLVAETQSTSVSDEGWLSKAHGR